MDINKELESLERLLRKSKLTKDELEEAQEQAKKLKSEIASLGNDPLKSDYERRLSNSQKLITTSLTSLKVTAEETDNIFEKILGDLSKGLDSNANKIGGLTSAAQEFFDVFLLNSPGSNIAFWREYDRRIREVGVSYGLSANRLEDYRIKNKELEQNFISLGGTAEGLQEAIAGLYDETNQTNQLTDEFVDTLGGIVAAMGGSEREAGKFIGTMTNLNVSYQTTSRILTDLRNSAEKAALNTQKVLSQFSDNFERLNTFSFRNGVQGMMDMVKQSNMLKLNMEKILSLSDDFTDPEKTMEFASNMQLLGGSFAQLGDFNQLMYDAAVAPEELAKNIAKATSSLGYFNKETGTFEMSFADRLQLKEAAKQLNMTSEELNKVRINAAKVSDIKVSLGFKELTEDQYSVLGAMAQFDSARGEYTIRMRDESGEEVTKSIAELSPDDIEKISKTKEIEELKSLATQKLDVIDMMVTNLKIGKYESFDVFKAMGGLDEDVKSSVNDAFKSAVDLLKTIKTDAFVPLENLFASLAKETAVETLKDGKVAIDLLNGSLENLFKTVLNKESIDVAQQFIDSFFSQAASMVSESPTEKKREGDILSVEKFNTGKILDGLSHEQGGIPFSIGGKLGFEAEGGEILLTKGVSQDPLLLSLASKINELGGGKRLYEHGDVLTNNTSLISSNYNSLEKKIDDGDKNIETINNLLNTNYNTSNTKLFEDGDIIKNSNQSVNSNYNTSNTKLFEDGDIIKNSNQSVNSIYNVLNKKLDPIKDIIPKNETIVNNNYSNVNKEVFEDGGIVNNRVNTNNVISETIKSIETFKDEYSNSINNVIQNLNQQSISYDSVLNSMNDFRDRMKDVTQNLSQFTNINTNLNSLTNNSQTSNINNSQFKTNFSNEEYNSILAKYITQPGTSELPLKDFYNKTNQINNTSETTNQSVDAQYVKSLNVESMMNNITNSSQSSAQYGQTTNEFKDVTNVIGEVGKVMQGGLIERRDRSELLNGNINVNGNVKVDGTISFTNPSITVKIDGLPGGKEFPMPDNLTKEIYRVVGEEIGNMSLYTKYITQKGTGIVDGKSVNIPGITTDISPIA